MKTYMSVSQIAKKAGVSRQAVWGWINRGLSVNRLRSHRLGRQHVIRKSDVEQFLKAINREPIEA